VVTVLPILVVLVVLVNALTWVRPRPVASGVRVRDSRVRVCIPARNEALRCGPPIEAARRQAEVHLLDDGSTDGTAAVARSAGAVVHTGDALPEGWVGKPWALQQLGEQAVADGVDVLILLDADVVLEPGAIDAIVSELETCDVFTAVPRQAMGSLAERLVLPLLHLTYVSWLPLALIERVAHPGVVAANGQIVALRTSTWSALGGFQAAAHAVVDDLVFCRAAKRAGKRVRFADGTLLGTCRMYEDFGTVVRGFSKNIYEGLGGPVALWAAILLYLSAFVVPYGVLLAGLLGVEGALVPGAIAVGANLTIRGWLAVRHGHPLSSVVLHPFGVLVLCAIALNSWRWSRSASITWAGRTYPSAR
jgi:hypothetical protein